MPGTAGGLFLFALLVTPGLAYFTVRDRRIPQRELSPFRETAAVLFATVVFNVVAALIFVGIRAWLPGKTPDVGALVRQGSVYLKQHFLFVGGWGLGLLVFAALVGAFVGKFGSPGLWLGPIEMISAWHKMFDGITDAEIYCGCQLDDGSWVGGYLNYWSTETREIPDRDLILVPPIRRTSPSGEEDPRDVTAVIVSARRLVQLEVSYVERGSAERARARGGEEDKASGPEMAVT